MARIGSPSFDPIPSAQIPAFAARGHHAIVRVAACILQHTCGYPYRNEFCVMRREDHLLEMHQKDIAEELGLGEHVVSRCIERLVYLGHVAVEKHRIYLCGEVKPHAEADSVKATRHAAVIARLASHVPEEQREAFAEADGAALVAEDARIAAAVKRARDESAPELEAVLADFNVPLRARRKKPVHAENADSNSNGIGVYTQPASLLTYRQTDRAEASSSSGISASIPLPETTTTMEVLPPPDEASELAMVEAALEPHGGDPDAARQMLDACRKADATASAGAVAFFVASKAAIMPRGVRRPVGWLLTAVPKCFANAGWRRRFGEAVTGSAVAVSPASDEWLETLLADPAVPDDDKEIARKAWEVQNAG
jgi:hypothetical protein